MVVKIVDNFSVLANIIPDAKKNSEKVHNPKALESLSGISGKTEVIPLRYLCEDTGLKNSTFGKC